MAAYSDDGLSLLATKLGTPNMLDSYTAQMCTESWGRSGYPRALVELDAEREFKDILFIAIPNLERGGHKIETMNGSLLHVVLVRSLGMKGFLVLCMLNLFKRQIPILMRRVLKRLKRRVETYQNKDLRLTNRNNNLNIDR